MSFSMKSIASIGLDRDAMLEILQSRSIPEPNTGCWIWMGSTQGRGMGYGLLYVGTGSRTKAQAHRLSIWAHKRLDPEGHVVMHSCDVPSCVNPAHLSLGTIRSNLEDRDRKGRVAHGERHYRVKLTDEQVRELRRRRASGELLAALAREYGILPSTASQIASGARRARVA